MHQVIYVLVDASTEDDALAQAKAAFDRLVGVTPDSAGVFDYYVTFDDDSSTVAGKARWGDLPVAARVESEDGQDLLERGWDATVEEFERNLDRAREALDELSRAELMRNEELARNACYNLGAYRGPAVYCYDEFGTGIRHRDQLDSILDTDEQVWIIPADVHY